MPHPQVNKQECQCVSKYYEGELNEHLKSETKNSKHSSIVFKLTTMIVVVWSVPDRWQYDAGMQKDGSVVV